MVSAEGTHFSGDAGRVWSADAVPAPVAAGTAEGRDHRAGGRSRWDPPGRSARKWGRGPHTKPPRRGPGGRTDATSPFPAPGFAAPLGPTARGLCGASGPGCVGPGSGSSRSGPQRPREAGRDPAAGERTAGDSRASACRSHERAPSRPTPAVPATTGPSPLLPSAAALREARATGVTAGVRG